MRILTSDFETANAQYNIENRITWVWLYDFCDIETLEHITGYSIQEFFDELKRIGTCKIYFHNIEFDGIFILDYLLKNGYVNWDGTGAKPKYYVKTLITELNLIYFIEFNVKTKHGMRVVKICDSAKKISSSVEDIAKSWNLPILKGVIDYKLDRRNYKATQQDIDYIHNDTEIIALVLRELYANNMTKLTSASDTFNKYKDTIKYFDSLFPVVSQEVDDFVRESYRGGVVLLRNKYKNKILHNVKVYDVNSMYPAQMLKNLPYGEPVYFKGQYQNNSLYPLYIQKIEVCCKLKKHCMPTILTSGNTRYIFNSYLTDTENQMFELTLTNIDLELLFKNYEIYDINYIDGYMFKASDKLFAKYILPLYDQKSHSKGAKKLLAKLLLNSLYGKFAFNPKHINKTPYINEFDTVKFELGEPNFTAPIYTAMASFITAYARQTLITAINANYENFVYCDTDSIHLLDEAKDIIVDKTILGEWDLEKTYIKAKYLQQKRYIGEKENGLDIKCAGCTKAVKKQINFDNFEFGNTFNGNLKKQIVNGGCVLVDSTFELKDTTLKI